MEALFGCGRPGWAGHLRGVGDRECGEHPAGGAGHARYERRGPKAGGEGVRVQVDRAGDARKGRQYGDGQQAAESGHIVIDRGRDTRLFGGRRVHRGRGERCYRDRQPEPEDDDRRQHVQHIAGPVGGERERTAPLSPNPPRAVDVLLDAVTLRLTEGYAAAAPALNRALKMVLALDVSSGEAGYWLWLAGGRISQIIAMELWDFESWYALAVSQVQFSRERGALTHLTFALNYLARAHILAGELATAARLVEEDHLIAEATGNPPIAYTEMMLAAWRGQEQEASGLVEAISREAAARDVGRLASLAAYASSVLHNSLRQHDAACDAARLAFEREPMGLGSHIVPELAEAAARTGDVALVEAAMEWLSERTRVTPTEWVLGIEARARALLCDGDAAESCHRESIERLGRTRVRAHLARAHFALRRVAAPQAPPRRGPGAAAHRLRDAGRNRHRSVR
jgi:hypothetical protein